jgi:hypothetical protein
LTLSGSPGVGGVGVSVEPPQPARPTASAATASNENSLDQAERAKGQAWGLKTIDTFHTHGTPPVDAQP